jgi:hypothetical protein
MSFLRLLSGRTLVGSLVLAIYSKASVYCKKDEDDIEDAPIEALEPKALHPG